MPYVACGSSTSTHWAPRARSTSSAASNAAQHRIVDALGQTRRAERRSADRSTSPVSASRYRGTGSARRGGVVRIGTGNDLEQQRRVLGGARQRTNLIERRGKRQQPVARHASVGRLQADDAGERRRLTNRAAGVRAQRGRRQAARRRRPPSHRSIRPACDRSPTDCATDRTRSSRSTSPSRTRRGWSCR